jgi:hypothetical protein
VSTAPETMCSPPIPARGDIQESKTNETRKGLSIFSAVFSFPITTNSSGKVVAKIMNLMATFRPVVECHSKFSRDPKASQNSTQWLLFCSSFFHGFVEIFMETTNVTMMPLPFGYVRPTFLPCKPVLIRL